MAKKLRLDKLLSDTGRWSRKEAGALIRQGAVQMDGVPLRKPEERLDPEAVSITVDGVPLVWSAHSYLMLNKPAGYLTATEDRSAPTVMDLIPDEMRKPGLAPVGRLDKDTTGLLLITDDGALAHGLLSPKRHVDKIYLAWVDGTGTEEDCAAFARGIVLGDGTKCLPARLELVEPGLCRVTVREGKFHQVKRMLASRNLPVTALKRVKMGPLALDEALSEGAVRSLTAAEIDRLRQAAAINGQDSSKCTK